MHVAEPRAVRRENLRQRMWVVRVQIAKVRSRVRDRHDPSHPEQRCQRQRAKADERGYSEDPLNGVAAVASSVPLSFASTHAVGSAVGAPVL
jgi:hypothetical protein